MMKQEEYVRFNHTIVPYGDFFNPHARKDREKKKRLNESGACLGEEKIFHF